MFGPAAQLNVRIRCSLSNYAGAGFTTMSSSAARSQPPSATVTTIFTTPGQGWCCRQLLGAPGHHTAEYFLGVRNISWLWCRWRVTGHLVTASGCCIVMIVM